MGDLKSRLFTIIIGSAFSLLLLLSHVYTLCLFFTLIMFVCLIEFHASIKNTVGKLYSSLISTAVYSLIISYSFNLIDQRKLILILPLILSLFGFEILAKAKFSFRNVGLGLICVIWIAIPFALCTSICITTNLTTSNEYPNYNPLMIIGILLIIWFNDAGAYCVGRLIGCTPLHPALSPKKTWEGSIGGGLVSLIVGLIVGYHFNFLNYEQWSIITAICIVCGSIGDLIESMFKRSIEIKDTGHLLPGHGGLLDRFDAVIFSVPFIFSYLVLIGHIN